MPWAKHSQAAVKTIFQRDGILLKMMYQKISPQLTPQRLPNAAIAEFSSSNFHEGTQIATINTRFVYAMRSIGKGAEAGRMFCGVMNLPQPPTRFSPYAVAVDGTWQKRGYTSLNGVVTVTSIDTGSSGAMEIQGASKIFQRSLSLHNARYITYLGDGDCKAFDAEKKKNIYGNEYPIEKLECIGHVMKRMGTRLRRLKAQLKGQILSDAIRRNHSSVQNMRQAIWAIFLHKLSTDEYPQHGFCPIGEDSWCGFKKAEASGKSYKHKNSLPVAVVEAMRPIFRDLSHPDLLKKCLHGKTQNLNESFHNVVWSRVPKATFVQIETLSLGVYDAVCSFNDGNISKLKMLQKMGVEPGNFHDEAYIWLNGYVNKQNCRIWSEDNPQVYVETPLHPEELTVWCA
ncbi:uncharacterized protein TNCV_1963101 [Trichonephila clavipes]|nr:uncharacterized protein TNCV_1963101 [Trichonephila clavipes]